jgi:hypothetical protein
MGSDTVAITTLLVTIGLAVLALMFAIAIGTAVIARNKGRSAVAWFFLSILATLILPFGGVILLLVAALMSKRVPQAAPAQAAPTPTPSPWPAQPAPLQSVSPPPPAYDRNRWDALMQADSDVALSAAQLAPYGEHYVAELAAATLSVGGRANLAANTARLIERARSKRSRPATPTA